ncbi:MAG: NAD(P)-dependent oxidoreductase, partial [Alphaproteobacteria bacterium]|nr:NAD(P)-dependent oxidoreductase [Alphaproteobacteria bacterium]
MATTIGFIGLGLMGSGFTKRLVASGFRVVGHDKDAAKVAAAAVWGVEPAPTAAAVARASDVVLVCVMSTADVEVVALGAEGVAAAGRLDGKVLVDHSTTIIADTRRIAAELERRTGMEWVDA